MKESIEKLIISIFIGVLVLIIGEIIIIKYVRPNIKPKQQNG